MPKVSVIIPTRNHEKFIKACIESILNQTFQDFEIVITDDASQDQTVEIIKGFREPRLQLFQLSEAMGVSVATNNCIKRSSGRYLAWMGPDSLWAPTKLEIQVRYLDEHPTTGAVFGKGDWVNFDGEVISDADLHQRDILDTENRSRFEWLRYFFQHGNCLPLSCSLVRRDCYEKAGLFNPSLANLFDLDLWIRICFHDEIHILDEKLARFSSITEDIHSRRQNRFENKQLLDHFLRIQNVDTLLAIFPEASKYGKISEDLIPYFLGRVALEQGPDYLGLWGLGVIYEMLESEDNALKLREQCTFTYQDFFKLTGTFDSFNLAALEQRDALIQLRNSQISEIYASTTWRLAEFTTGVLSRMAPRGSRVQELRRLSLRVVQVFRKDGPTALLRKIFGWPPPQRSPREEIRRKVQQKASARLQTFFSSNASLALPVFGQPTVSIILLCYNRAEMSLQCLESLAVGAGYIPYEVIIVDNASTDETHSLLDHLQNAKIIRNSVNRGFGSGINQAVDLAVGKYLLFLNNDTQLEPDSLKALVETIESGKDIGAVGGKLIFPDGRLQEAGSIIWQDGSCLGYGRDAEPGRPEYSYQKEVDFCSGALLLTPKELFLTLGKFDPRYEPAYYEDVDYCMTLWEKGYHVIYQPLASAIHFEFGSSGRTGAIALQIENRTKFIDKWQHVLPKYLPPDPKNIIFAREHKSASKRLLMIDDQIPDYRLGSGLPRTYEILEELARMGYQLTFFPLQITNMVPDIVRALQMKGIEVLYQREDDPRLDFKTFLKSRPAFYDIIFVSRPHNMQKISRYLEDYAGQSAVVYDGEALFSFRELKFNELSGKRLSDAEKTKLFEDEVSLVKGADVVTTVSPMEKELFEKHGASNVQILSHVVKPKPTPALFEDRADILFVGGILASPSPNEDAVLYFVNQILPLIRQELKCDFYIVGTNRVKSIWELKSEYVHVLGRVDDLLSFYNHSRLFVAPSRYAAGIPIKVLEAVAHGLPAVVSPLLANQLGWQENQDLLVGRDPEEFAKKVIALYSNRDLFYLLRQNGLDRIQREYGREHFVASLERVLKSATETHHSKKASLAPQNGSN